MSEVRIHIEKPDDAPVRVTLDLPGRRVVERAPIAGREPRGDGLPVIDLPESMWSRDDRIAPGAAPRAPAETPLIAHDISARAEDPAPALAPAAPAVVTGRHTFREAAEHYVTLRARKLSIDQEKAWLAELMPFIGEQPLDRVYDGTLQGFIEAQRTKPIPGGKIGVKSKTLNLKLGLVRHILRLASRSWRDDEGQTWLPSAPLITMQEGGDERAPRQLTWSEQREHLDKLPEHLRRMALFDLQCGARDDVVCSLRWAWEVIVPELDILTFIVPPDHVKGQRGKKHARAVVCNSVARGIVESVRGQDPEHVFVYQRYAKTRASRASDPTKTASPIGTMNNTAWKNWRSNCGLGDLHVHDLRHTVGMRLREAGVLENTIADVLWHRRASMTGHYSVAQVHELHAAVEKLTSPVHATNKTLATIALEQKRGTAT